MSQVWRSRFLHNSVVSPLHWNGCCKSFQQLNSSNTPSHKLLLLSTVIISIAPVTFLTVSVGSVDSEEIVNHHNNNINIMY